MLTENFFTEIEQRCEHLGEICDYVVVDNLLCLSCYVKTDAPYFLVYDNGKIIYKDYDENNYLSNLNKEGYGNGLVIMDLKSLQIIKLMEENIGKTFSYFFDQTSSPYTIYFSDPFVL